MSLAIAIRQMDDATQFFETAINNAKINAGGRSTMEGPHGVPSSKTVGSIRITLNALKCIRDEIQSVNETYVQHVCPKSLVILIVEHSLKNERGP